MDIVTELNNVVSQLETKQKELYKSVNQLREIQTNISSIKAAVNKLIAKLTDFTKKDDSLKQEYNNLRTEFNTADKTRKARIKSRTDEIAQIRKALMADYKASVNAINTNRANLEQLESSSDTSRLIDTISTLETEINALQAKQAQLENALAVEIAKESPLQDEPIEPSPVVTAPTPPPAPKPAKKKTKKAAAPVADITPSVVAQASASKSKSGGGRPPKPPQPPAPPAPSAPEPEPSGVGSAGEPLTPEQLELSKTRIRDKKAAEKIARFEKRQREDEDKVRRERAQFEREEAAALRSEQAKTVIDALAQIMAKELQRKSKEAELTAAFDVPDEAIADNIAFDQEKAAALKEAVRLAKEYEQETIAYWTELIASQKKQREYQANVAKDHADALKQEANLQKEYEQETIAYWQGLRDTQERMREFQANMAKDHADALKEEANLQKEYERESIAYWEGIRDTQERIREFQASMAKDHADALKEEANLQKEYERESIAYHMDKINSQKAQRKFENDLLKAHEAALKKEADQAAVQEKETITEAYFENQLFDQKRKALVGEAYFENSLIDQQRKARDEYDKLWQRLILEDAYFMDAHFNQVRDAAEKARKDREKTLLDEAYFENQLFDQRRRAAEQEAYFENSLIEQRKKAREEYQKAWERMLKEQEREDKEAISKVSTFVKHSISMFKSFADALLNMSNEIRKIQQQFGINAGVAANVIISSYMKSFGSLFSGASTPFVSAKQILETSQGFQEEFGGVLTGESATAIAQRGVRLGITPEQQATARRVFMTQTGGDREKAIAAESKFIAEFEAKNLTAKDAMKAIQQYSELIARNGTRFQTSFARAAIDAKKIGVDLSKVDQIGDNIIGNFEGFLEKSAELGAMGFGFDTSRLAELAETGDTGALLNELRSQLASTGKDITNLRRSEQLALSEAFGLSMADMQRLAGKTAGSGEQTMESLQESSNSFLSKLVNSSEKIFTVMGTVAGILGGVVSLLLAGIEFNTARIAAGNAAGGLSGALGRTLGGPMAGVGGKLLKGVGGIGAGLSAYGAYTTAKDKDMLSSVLSIASAAGTGFLAGGPAGAAIGGGLGLIGALAGSMTADDMVSKSGYGKRTLVTPTATVALNDKDNIVAYADDMVSREAGVNLLSKGAIVSEASNAKATSVNVDTSKLEAKLDNLAAKIASMGIYMDGNKVGKVLVNNSDVNSVGVFRTQARATL